MRCIVIAVSVLAVLAAIPFIPSADAVGNPGDQLLLDWGDGRYEWYSISSEGYLLCSVITNTLDENSVPYVSDGDSISSVGGVAARTVGGQECIWRIYIWDSYRWIYGEADGTESYAGGTLALAYYPTSSLVPVPTPYFPEVWTSYRGSSDNAGISGAEGPAKAAVPLEWYLTTDSGGVYSSILAADGLLYYVTGGNSNGNGVSRSPHLYCVDSVNHAVAWSFAYSLSSNKGTEQYEINTPVIVGDLIIVTSANRHVYCLDRMEGRVLSELVPEGESAHFAGSFDTYTYSYASTSTMTGGGYANGPTSAVYDSGALYFNTHDGALHCYSVTRENGFQELWHCLPTDPERGCFYFAAPTVTDLDGVRVVLSGSYSGRVYVVDAADGANLRTAEIADLGSFGMGAVAKIVSAGDGKAFVSVDDGGMDPRNGFIARLDLATLTVDWRIDAFTTSPVIMNGVIYAFIKPAIMSSDPAYERPQVWDKDGVCIDARSGFYAFSAADGHVIWANECDCYTKSGISYCDGRLYSVDYSTTYEWPAGGALRCIDPDTGYQLWAVKLLPGTYNAYCMCTPTVIEGKVYVGNDDGTLYCISEIPGRIDEETDDISYRSVALTHWSWLAMFAAVGSTLAAGVVIYRR